MKYGKDMTEEDLQGFRDDIKAGDQMLEAKGVLNFADAGWMSVYADARTTRTDEEAEKAFRKALEELVRWGNCRDNCYELSGRNGDLSDPSSFRQPDGSWLAELKVTGRYTYLPHPLDVAFELVGISRTRPEGAFYVSRSVASPESGRNRAYWLDDGHLWTPGDPLEKLVPGPSFMDVVEDELPLFVMKRVAAEGK